MRRFVTAPSRNHGCHTPGSDNCGLVAHGVVAARSENGQCLPLDMSFSTRSGYPPLATCFGSPKGREVNTIPSLCGHEAGCSWMVMREPSRLIRNPEIPNPLRPKTWMQPWFIL